MTLPHGKAWFLRRCALTAAATATAAVAGPVHVNADFYGQASDHDPLLPYFNIP